MSKVVEDVVIFLGKSPYRVMPSGRKYKQGRYLCHCGKEFVAITSNVNNRITRSCGCLHNKYHPRHKRNWK